MLTYESPIAEYSIFWGDDKYENELLLKYSQNRDVWFHVSKLSSAHVYLRCPHKMLLKQIPAELVELCSKIVKINSIEGSKQSVVDVDYTAVTNVAKRVDLDVGTVIFRNEKDCLCKRQVQCSRAEAKEIKKNTVHVELTSERLSHDLEAYKRRLINEQKEKTLNERVAKELELQQLEEKKRLVHYVDLFNKQDDSQSGFGQAENENQDSDPANLEDDFM